MAAFTRDPDPRVRANAVDALNLIGSPPDLKAAIACLGDKDPRVRAATITAAISTWSEPFLSHLQEMLRSNLVAERAAGLYALLSVTIPERQALLTEFYMAESQPKFYESCGDALAKELVASPPTEITRVLDQVPEGSKRDYLSRSLNRLTAGFVIPTPPEGSSSGDGANPFLSFSGLLDRKRDGTLTPALIRKALSREQDPISIIFLLECASEMKLEDAVELSQSFSHSADRRIRLASAEALGKLAGPEAIESLMFLVKDKDAEIARQALEELQRLDPKAALLGVESLLQSGQAATIRRGLELLEKLGDRNAIAQVLNVLQLASNPALVEPLSRLVVAWGDTSTLDHLAALYKTSGDNGRPFLVELGHALGTRLQVDPQEIRARFEQPPEGMTGPDLRSPSVTRVKTVTGPHSPPSSSGRGRVTSRSHGETPPKPALDLRAFLSSERGRMGTGLAAVIVLAVLMWPGARPPVPIQNHDNVVLHAQPAIVFASVAPRPPPSMEWAAAGGRAEVTALPPEPTLAEIELSLKVAYKSKGITSPAIIHLLAQDRVVSNYRIAIARAHESSNRGEYEAAMGILDAALAQLDQDHLIARLAVAKAMQAVARKNNTFDRMNDIRKSIEQIQKRLMDICIAAARDGGIPEASIKAVMERLESKEKDRAGLTRATDWMSARKMDGDKGDSTSGAAGEDRGKDVNVLFPQQMRGVRRWTPT